MKSRLLRFLSTNLESRKAVKAGRALKELTPEVLIGVDNRVSISELISGYRSLLIVPECRSSLVGFGLLTLLETYSSADNLLLNSKAVTKSITSNSAPPKIADNTNTYSPSGTLLEFLTVENKLIDAEWLLQEYHDSLCALYAAMEDVRICRPDDYDYCYRIASPVLYDFRVILLAFCNHYRKVLTALP